MDKRDEPATGRHPAQHPAGPGVFAIAGKFFRHETSHEMRELFVIIKIIAIFAPTV